MGNQALHILQDEDAGSLLLHIVDNVEKDSSTSSLVLKPLSLTSGGKGLAWEPCDVQIDNRELVVIPFSDVVEESLWWKISFDGIFAKYIIVARETMPHRDSQFLESLNRGFHSGAIGSNC